MLELWNNIPWLIRELIQIIVVAGLVRQYIVRDITTEIDKRGLLQDGLFHTIVRHLKVKAVDYREIYRAEVDRIKSVQTQN